MRSIELTLLCCSFTLCNLFLYAQTDTTFLEEIQILGVSVDEYTSGAKKEYVELDALQGSSLSALTEQTSLFIRSYGHNMLSTISLRGTGSSRTAVLWNGLNINSKTLGVSDFNLLPVWGASAIGIQYGASGALYGTDAIGGAINITNHPSWNNKSRVQFVKAYGSFGSSETKVKAKVANEKVESVTSLFLHSAKNDFEFANTTKRGHPIERQNNSDLYQYSVSQDVFIKTGQNSVFSINGWYTYHDRQVQPQMSAPNSEEEITNNNTRVLTAFKTEKSGHFLESKLAYIHDDELYINKFEMIVDQYIGEVNYHRSISELWLFRFGTQYTFIDVEGTSYGEVSEKRTDVYSSLTFNQNRTSISASLRKTLVQGTQTPYVPSIGIGYQLRRNLNLRGQLSLSYRLPTLNDKFWPSGNGTIGNPDLKSEKGYSSELGLDLTKVSVGLLGCTFSATAYYMAVTNWIQWTNEVGGLWTPQNLPQVISTGLESKLSVDYEIPVGKVGFSTDYRFTRVYQDEPGKERNTERRNLIYNPKHTLTNNLGISFHNLSMSVIHRFVGDRYFSESASRSLQSYNTVDLVTSYQMIKDRLTIELAAYNVNNEVYEPLPDYAVPGRNYRFSIQLNI